MDSNSLEVLRASFNLPILTREQEIALFERVKKGGPDAKTARQEILAHNVRLVYDIAKKMFPNFELGDKIQWGIIGLNRAIDRFDLRKGNKFSTYATRWIRQRISREAGRYSSCGFSLPSHISGDLSKLIWLVNREGFEPSVERIVNHPKMARTVKKKKVKVSKAQAVRLLELYTKHLHPASLDQEVVLSNGSNGGKLGDFVPNRYAQFAFDLAIDAESIDSLLSCLNKTQRRVITLRYLGEGMTVKEVGEQISLSPTTVRKIMARSLELMLEQALELEITSS